MYNKSNRASRRLASSAIAALMVCGLPLAAATNQDDGGDANGVGPKQGNDLAIPNSVPPPGYELEMLYIRFKDGVDPHEAMTALTDGQSSHFIPAMSNASWSRSTGDLKQDDLVAMHARAQETLGRSLPRPWQAVYVQLKEGADLGTAMAAVRETGFAIKALPVPKPIDLPYFAAPDLQNSQVYLRQSASNGIGAEAVWAEYGIMGQGVQVCDIEYKFDEDHCDLPPITMLGPFWETMWGSDHGTAVFGQLVSLDDGVGTAGIAHDVTQSYFSPAYQWDLDEDPPVRHNTDRAILDAVNNMQPGDVILIEQQLAGPNYDPDVGGQRGLVPIEWYEPYYDAIVLAVGNGLIVVEAAGNGSENLDAPEYSEGNGDHWPFLADNDSGAIIVGAGWSGRNNGGAARSRLSFSNYGETVDLQGWGESIMTAGYGDAWNEDNCDYSGGFGGTSGASPIVAGACILLQSYMKDRWNTRLTPAEMKWILGQTGHPQVAGQFPVAQNIGPLPDVYASIQSFEALTPIHRVPEDHDTIQEAVDAAGNGDTVLVGPGSWLGFHVEGKTLLIQSTNGESETFIEGSGISQCVSCLDSNIHIEGFTIQNCRALDGAGINAEGGEFTAKWCLFRHNRADRSGAGIHTNCQKAIITECFFNDNLAIFAGAGAHLKGHEAQVSHCIFEDNKADNGGGLNIRSEVFDVYSCSFSRNDSRFTGGGLDIWEGQGAITSCWFEDNISNKGGALGLGHLSDATVTRCEFWLNNARLIGGAAWVEDGQPLFDQCWMSDNMAVNTGGAIEAEGDAEPRVSQSSMCNNLPGHVNGDFQDLGGNCFADACVDADADGTLDECQLQPGDVNGDGDVTVDDLLAVIAAFGPCDGCPEDVNGDGVVDVNDVLQVLNCWGGGC